MLKRNNKIKLAAFAGFPEFNVETNIIMEECMTKIKKIYESNGFNPLDTRLVESIQTLERKGINGKEIYKLEKYKKDEEMNEEEEENKEDNGIIKALRFDLTLP